jgi:hypothetical protein
VVAGLPEEEEAGAKTLLENAVVERQHNLFDKSVPIRQSQYSSSNDDNEDERFKRFHGKSMRFLAVRRNSTFVVEYST